MIAASKATEEAFFLKMETNLKLATQKQEQKFTSRTNASNARLYT